MSKIAWIAGASGLIGQHLIEQLSEDERYSKIVAFVRKPLNSAVFQHPKVEQYLADFEDLQAPDSKADSLFCALGSTTHKTPDYDDYYRVDVSYPLKFASLGRDCGARYYGLVSAHGANANSFSNYLKMKGILEASLESLHFPQLTIARPSLLKGKRQEFRMLEKLGEGIMSLLPGNYQAIDARKVAQALIHADKTLPEGRHILSSKQMQQPTQLNR